MYPTYVITDDISASDAAWLRAQDGDGPLDLIDITDMCATMGVCAVVCTVGGSRLGYVDAKGTYTTHDPDCEPDTEADLRADYLMDVERDDRRSKR